MRIKNVLWMAFASLTLFSLSGGVARAGSTLYVNSYNTLPVYGTFDGSYGGNYGGAAGVLLDGTQVNGIYCVQFFVDINAYTLVNTTTNRTGDIHGSQLPNVGEVAWLLANVSPTVGSDRNLQAGLQAAIWDLTQTGGHTFVIDQKVGGNNSAAMLAAYNSDIQAAATHTGSVGSVLWINPTDPHSGAILQGLATYSPVASVGGNTDPVSTPEPATLATAVLGTLAGVIVYARRSRKHAV